MSCAGCFGWTGAAGGGTAVLGSATMGAEVLASSAISVAVVGGGVGGPVMVEVQERHNCGT